MSPITRSLLRQPERSRVVGRLIARVVSRVAVCGGIVLGVAAGGGGTAAAYVRARTPDTFVPLFWQDPRRVLEVARPPDGLGISSDELQAAATLAVGAWSYPALDCTALSVHIAPEVTDSQVAGRDDRNRIIMRTGNWCRDPVTLYKCHDPAAVALTTIFSRKDPGAPDDGEILEADIEVNAVGDYPWAVIPDGPISGRDYANLYDLTSVLTHEAGHFIGLDHNCLLPTAPFLVDDQGTATPDCFALPPAEQAFIQDATMYPFMSPGEVKLRSLTPDDARAACAIYPPGSVPIEEWVGGGGCAIAMVPRTDTEKQPGAFSLFVLLGALLSVRTRPKSAR